MWTAELERGRASREPRERAGALAVIVGPEDGQTNGRAGERAIQRTTFASHGPLEGSTEGRKNEAKPLQLPLFHPLARSLVRLYYDRRFRVQSLPTMFPFSMKFVMNMNGGVKST